MPIGHRTDRPLRRAPGRPSRAIHSPAEEGLEGIRRGDVPAFTRGFAEFWAKRGLTATSVAYDHTLRRTA